MIREFALICTAQKKIDGKIVLKETPLCDCIIGKKTFLYITIVTSKPRRFCLYELEGKRRRRYGRT